MKATLVTIFILSLFTSCYYDSEEALFPQLNSNTIDTSKTISFSEVIDPMIKSNCRSCHSGGNSVRLADYNDISSQADNIYKSISHASGILPMPQAPAPKLDDIYIVAFKKWMEQGKQNN